jgi:EAL domain-containing protein (putative c-di-GMP-specific phosphodiesterase class I)
MDDMGASQSTLGRLRSIRFDRLKIDPSYTQDTEAGPHQAILKAVVALGEGLGMETTAGGVDTSEQLARLRAHGWSEVQGNLVGRPMSAKDVAALLADRPASPLTQEGP